METTFVLVETSRRNFLPFGQSTIKSAMTYKVKLKQLTHWAFVITPNTSHACIQINIRYESKTFLVYSWVHVNVMSGIKILVYFSSKISSKRNVISFWQKVLFSFSIDIVPNIRKCLFFQKRNYSFFILLYQYYLLKKKANKSPIKREIVLWGLGRERSKIYKLIAWDQYFFI